MISFNAVAQKKQYPSAYKKSRSPDPFHRKEQDDASKNHGDANAMQELIPAGFVLVVVLRHVVRQARHQRTSCQPISTAIYSAGEQPPWNSDCIPKLGGWLESSMSTERIVRPAFLQLLLVIACLIRLGSAS